MNVPRGTFALLALWPSLALAAPIETAISLDSGIYLASDAPFTVAGFWSPEPGLDPTLSNPLTLPQPTWTGSRYVLSAPFPALTCGRVQIDAFTGSSIEEWAAVGLYGQVVDSGRLCDPPVCLDCAPVTTCTDCGTVPEPATLTLFALGLCVAYRRRR